jgi:hypothetical protein
MRYKCLFCGEIYAKEEVALTCCYDSDNVYQCEICQEVWNYHWQANDCCKAEKVEVVE